MEDAVDVVEQVFFADGLARVGAGKVRQTSIGDGITAAQSTLTWLGKKVVF
ncbi:hypothetical protein D3C84_1245960 [compost metagenome]